MERAAKNDGTAPTPIIPTRARLPEQCTVTALCLPAHDESDELVASMMTQLLELRGYCATAMSQSALASEMVDAVANKSADIILVSALPPTALTHARYLCSGSRLAFLRSPPSSPSGLSTVIVRAPWSASSPPAPSSSPPRSAERWNK